MTVNIIKNDFEECNLYCDNVTSNYYEYVTGLSYCLSVYGIENNIISEKKLPSVACRGSILYIPKIQISCEHKRRYSMLSVNVATPESVSYRCSDAIRKYRQKIFNNAVFISSIDSIDNVAPLVPTIIDNIIFIDNKEDCEFFRNNCRQLSENTCKGFLDVLCNF